MDPAGGGDVSLREGLESTALLAGLSGCLADEEGQQDRHRYQDGAHGLSVELHRHRPLVCVPRAQAFARSCSPAATTKASPGPAKDTGRAVDIPHSMLNSAHVVSIAKPTLQARAASGSALCQLP